MSKTQAAPAPDWGELERQAYYAYREWPIWLMLRERELSARLKAQAPRSKPAAADPTIAEATTAKATTTDQEEAEP